MLAKDATLAHYPIDSLAQPFTQCNDWFWGFLAFERVTWSAGSKLTRRNRSSIGSRQSLNFADIDHSFEMSATNS